MTRPTIVVIALAVLSCPAFAQEEGSPSSFPTRDIGIGLLQFGATEGAGVVGMGAGYAALIVGIMSTGEDAFFTPAAADIVGVVALAAVGLSPLGEAEIVSLVGNRFYEPEGRGSFGWTAGGAYLGALAALGIGIAGSLATHQQGWLPSSWYVPCLFLPAAGAVVGYQLSRPNPMRNGEFGMWNSGHSAFPTPHSALASRFDLPSIGLRFNAKSHAQPSTALNLRLLSVRF